MSQKHMTKKELNEDPFFEEVAHIIDFFRTHQTLLIAIIVALVVVAGAFFGGKAVVNQQSIKASGYFGIAMDYYNKDQMLEAEDQFMLVAEQYKRNDWGKRSYYYLALVSQNLGKAEVETLDYLESFVKSDVDDDALKASAYQLIGTHYYRNGDLLSAGENYLKAAKKALGKSEKLRMGMRAGEAFIEAGESKELDSVINYLSSLELTDIEKTRIEALAVR